jgi:hypothetical protein
MQQAARITQMGEKRAPHWRLAPTSPRDRPIDPSRRANSELRQRFAASQQAEFAAVLGAPFAREEDPQMEIAAFIMVSTVVLWFLEEAADQHV